MNTLSFKPLRLAIALAAAATLVLGILAGLSRLHLDVTLIADRLAIWHGPLLASAFFGTVISLERAVAIRTPLAYGAPLLSALGALALLLANSVPAMQLLSIFAAALLCFLSIQMLQKMAADFTIVLAIAAASWLVGNLAWWLSGNPAQAAVPWLAFLVITIAGERLELTRFLRTSVAAKRWCYATVAVITGGAVLASLAMPFGHRVFAAGLIALALWLMRWDIARHNIRQSGITRYIAACLLGGYAWLGVAGVLGIMGAFDAGHVMRDSALHALALGFVLAMVFGHALIIVPAITGLKVPYHPAFYLPLLLLHLSLLARVAGRGIESVGLVQFGALANAATLVAFAAILLWRVKASPARK